MLKKVLLIATATAFFVAVGVPETSFGPASAFAATKCGEGMRKNWRGKCVKAKAAKTKMVAKTTKKKSSKKRRKRSKAKEG
jgi:hypothetical protein